MNPEEQNMTLEVVCSILFCNIDYNLLDPENLLIVKVVNQLELVEKCLTR